MIEQAKGVLSERTASGIGLGQAFELMRRHARSHNQGLSDLVRTVVERSSTVEGLLQPSQASPRSDTT